MKNAKLLQSVVCGGLILAAAQPSPRLVQWDGDRIRKANGGNPVGFLRDKDSLKGKPKLHTKQNV